MSKQNNESELFSLTAETSVLGGLLLDEKKWDAVADILSADQFYNGNHKLLYKAMSELIAAKRSIDAVTVSEQLEKTGKLKAVGGMSSVIQLAQDSPFTANILDYAKIVLERWQRRQLNTIGQEIQLLAKQATPDEVSGTVAKAEHLVTNLVRKVASHQNTVASDAVALSQLAMQHRIDRENAGGALSGIATGFRELDRLLDGLQKGGLYIIAGRPSMGKSAFALNAMVNMAAARHNPLLFSMEMPNEQNSLRVISKISGIPFEHLKRGEALPKAANQQFLAACETLAQLSLHMVDSSTMTVAQIRAASQHLHRTENVDVIFVDYLQLATDERGTENRAEFIASVSRGLKKLAMDLQVPVVGLSQLNRAVEGRVDKRPMLSDLKESGGIEQDADAVLMLYRDEYYNKQTEDLGIAEVIITKSRNGPTGTVKMLFEGANMQFANLHNDGFS